MKKSLLLAMAASLLLCACGTTAGLGHSSDGQKYPDGIYGNTPSFRSRTETAVAHEESDALIEKTKGSTIYLFGDKKDTVFIPKEMAATISFDNTLGTTVTIAENDWRYDSPWSWGIGYNSWYWNSWAYSPWHYGWHSPWRYSWHNPWHYSWYDPWYFGGWYDPWYYGGWYDPWYYGYAGWYGGFYGPHYCGWYGGWDPFWPGYHPGHHPGHHPHHVDTWKGPRHQTGSDRVFASRTTSRGGLGTSSASRRSLTPSDSRTLSKSATASSGRAVRTAGTNRSTAAPAPGKTGVRTSPVRTSPSVRNNASSSQNSTAATSATAKQVTRSSNYRRPAGSTSASSGASYGSSSPASSRSSVSSSGSSGYNRSNQSYSRSGSSQTTRSSGFSTGSAGRSSGSFSGGGASRSSGGYSGGASRSGGGSGARR